MISARYIHSYLPFKNAFGLIVNSAGFKDAGIVYEDIDGPHVVFNKRMKIYQLIFIRYITDKSMQYAGI